MKRIVSCVSALALWFLIFSAVFSLRVEQWMAPAVTVTEGKLIGNQTHVPLDCLFETEEGNAFYKLGTAYEVGSAWEAGTRARASAEYQIVRNYNTTEGSGFDLRVWGQRFIQYATKMPRDGEPVNVVVLPERLEDQWLIVAKGDSLPEFRALSPGYSLLDQTDREMLVQADKVSQPFMEKRARSLVPPLLPNLYGDDYTTPEGWQEIFAAREQMPRYYSLRDLGQWMGQIPKIGLLAGLILASLVIWGYSCWLARSYRKHRGKLILNGVVAAVLLGTVAFVLFRIDLPSSLLPSTHIVDFRFYAREFGQVFSGLKHLAAQGSAVAKDMVTQARREIWLCIGIVAAFLAAAAVLCLAERSSVAASKAASPPRAFCASSAKGPGQTGNS